MTKIQSRNMLVKSLSSVHYRTGHESPQGASRDISSLFVLTSALDGGGWSTSSLRRPIDPLMRKPVFILQEAVWSPGSVCMGAENLVLTGIRSPNRTSRSDLLYRLRYPDTLASYCISCVDGGNILFVIIISYTTGTVRGLP
jgi:hypothetical protein